jgi:hypothetical protein
LYGEWGGRKKKKKRKAGIEQVCEVEKPTFHPI